MCLLSKRSTSVYHEISSLREPNVRQAVRHLSLNFNQYYWLGNYNTVTENRILEWLTWYLKSEITLIPCFSKVCISPFYVKQNHFLKFIYTITFDHLNPLCDCYKRLRHRLDETQLSDYFSPDTLIQLLVTWCAITCNSRSPLGLWRELWTAPSTSFNPCWCHFWNRKVI